MDVGFFSCVSYFVGTFPGAAARPAVTATSDRVDRRFVRLNEHYAEPYAGANRAGPWSFALEFLVGSCQFSGRSAWSFGGFRPSTKRLHIFAHRKCWRSCSAL